MSKRIYFCINYGYLGIMESRQLSNMRIETITSTQNRKVKMLLELQEKSKARRKEGLFVVEGYRELLHCISAGYQAYSVFVCEDILSSRQMNELAEVVGNSCSFFSLPKQLYEKVAYREGTEGVIAEIKCKEHNLRDLTLKENPLVVVLESVEKPGNLGAVLRSADAAGADAVIICDPLTDLYNPNLIRSSIGGIFTVQTASASSEDAINWLKDNNIRILTAQLQDSKVYYDTDMKVGTAIVMGTESTGLSDLWRKAADSHIMIPMLGQLDSLNVSVSAAILLYEAVRQRNSK